METLQMSNELSIVPCNHKVIIKAKFVAVPLLNENGFLQLCSRGRSVVVKSVTYCAHGCCEKVFDYEPIDGKRESRSKSLIPECLLLLLGIITNESSYR